MSLVHSYADPTTAPSIDSYTPSRQNVILKHDKQDLFQEFGELESARIIKERGSGRSLGYGFVKVRGGIHVCVHLQHACMYPPHRAAGH